MRCGESTTIDAAVAYVSKPYLGPMITEIDRYFRDRHRCGGEMDLDSVKIEALRLYVAFTYLCSGVS